MVIEPSEESHRRGFVIHQDNGRTHTSIVTNQKLRELAWDALMPPPYTRRADLAPSEFFL